MFKRLQRVNVSLDGLEVNGQPVDRWERVQEARVLEQIDKRPSIYLVKFLFPVNGVEVLQVAENRLSASPREPWSEHFLDELKAFDSDPRTDEQEREEWKETWKKFLESFEGFSSEEDAELARFFGDIPDFLPDILDETYVRQLLTQVPDVVQRTLRLTQIVPRKFPSKTVDAYLSEATRCFVFGLWNASSALARAAVELALKQAISQRGTQPPRSLMEAVSVAVDVGVLDGPNQELANQVLKTGNAVLHNRPADEQQAWGVLCAARGILAHIYGMS